MESDKKKVKVDPEKKAKYNDKYYNKHKDKLLANLTVKVYCETCKCHCSKVNMKKHERTPKHLRNMKTENA